ncbi:neuropeptide-like protein C4orf48 homolog isoform X2 [Poeciliopsis prolifica]|uniref:neuropeptide-like protein C4orf48 homolog isoform X2 n=1 Tax=Poeciliopsis prolifica TaxID=188132 RepID=UPI002413F36C|nr:neuropeptide-like protein C4orf48 homolog isoform X2 [Poeciliopsis prolifica]
MDRHLAVPQQTTRCRTEITNRGQEEKDCKHPTQQMKFTASSTGFILKAATGSFNSVPLKLFAGILRRMRTPLHKPLLGGHFKADLAALKNILGSSKQADRTVAMASSGSGVQAALVLVLLAVQLVCVGAAEADQETGTVIPAESRPCVDCHAFEFMQRALQDLKKTAFNLDARTETLVLRAERRALCDCMPTTTLR